MKIKNIATAFIVASEVSTALMHKSTDQLTTDTEAVSNIPLCANLQNSQMASKGCLAKKGTVCGNMINIKGVPHAASAQKVKGMPASFNGLPLCDVGQPLCTPQHMKSVRKAGVACETPCLPRPMPKSSIDQLSKQMQGRLYLQANHVIKTTSCPLGTTRTTLMSHGSLNASLLQVEDETAEETAAREELEALLAEESSLLNESNFLEWLDFDYDNAQKSKKQQDEINQASREKREEERAERHATHDRSNPRFANEQAAKRYAQEAEATKQRIAFLRRQRGVMAFNQEDEAETPAQRARANRTASTARTSSPGSSSSSGKSLSDLRAARAPQQRATRSTAEQQKQQLQSRQTTKETNDAVRAKQMEAYSLMQEEEETPAQRARAAQQGRTTTNQSLEELRARRTGSERTGVARSTAEQQKQQLQRRQTSKETNDAVRAKQMDAYSLLEKTKRGVAFVEEGMADMDAAGVNVYDLEAVKALSKEGARI